MSRIPFRILGFIWLGIVLAGCPKTFGVTKFDVKPKHVCHGTVVAIAWETEGAESVELSSNPVVSPLLGSVELNGATTRRVEETTRFTVEASKGSSTDRKTETVEVVPPGGKDQLFGTFGQCVAGIPRWLVVVHSDEWDENLRVRTVWNQSGRDVIVSHEGRTQAFPALGGRTEFFRGTRLTGDWTIAPILLLPSEGCPAPGTTIDPGRPAPVLGGLTIGVNAGCD